MRTTERTGLSLGSLSGTASPRPDDTGSPPLFQADWWLDAATDGQWQQAEVRRAGTVVASLPYVVRRRAGLRLLGHPPYTRTVAPQLRAPGGKAVSRRACTVRLLRELMSQLPKHDHLQLVLDPDAGAPLAFPFVALGYLVGHNYTFVAPAGTSVDALWRGMEQKTRNVVATAAKRFAVTAHSDLDRFVRLSRGERGDGRRNGNDFAVIARIFEACAARGQCTVLSASDGRVDVATSVLVWDGNRAYHWLSARDPRRAGTGAGGLLIWEGMRFALTRGLAFDADGFNTTNAALFLAPFGLELATRPVVTRGSLVWRMALLTRTALQPDAYSFYRA